MAGKPALDLLNKKFGKLTVEKLLGSNGKGLIWLCRCTCGRTRECTSNGLSRGDNRTCGVCSGRSTQRPKRPPRKVGDRVGMLVLLEQLGNKYWLCKCDCGKTVKKQSQAIKHGCGCVYEKNLAEQRRIRKIKEEKEELRILHNKEKLENSRILIGKIRNTHWTQIQTNARVRNLEFSITPEEVWKIFEAQEGKCALTGIDLVFKPQKRGTTASLDRIDNSKGYVSGNVQWVYKSINIMKWIYSQEEFIALCRLVRNWNTELVKKWYYESQKNGM